VNLCAYDSWKATEPAPTEPDPPDVHEQCELTIERLEAELAALHLHVDALEVELAACKESRS